MRKGRSRSAKIATMKKDSKQPENKPVPKEKERSCLPRVDMTAIDWSDKMTHPAVWSVLTLIFTGLLIYLIVLVCSIDWTVAQRVKEPGTTTAATTFSAATTPSEETSTVDGHTKAQGSTISLREKMGASQHLSANQDFCETCSSQLSQPVISSSVSGTCEDNHRCSVNSQCTDDGVDVYTCACDVVYYGRYCDVALSDCERLLCNSHGKCRKRIATQQIYCSCTGGYTGDNCEVDPVAIRSPCSNLTTPCSGSGLCIDLSEEDYICACNSGYNGTDCEVDINDCDSSPCYHGNCTDIVNGFSCDCELGYEGMQCQTVTDIDDCSTNLCPTHSICIDLINNYTCLCDVGYTGIYCYSLCDDEPCFNNATCSLCEGGPCNGTGLPFRCNCTENGTYGVLCTDRDGYWSNWSDWVSAPDFSIEILTTDKFSSPLTNCTYLNTTRTRQCLHHLSAGRNCEGSSYQEAALTDGDIDCECLICCEDGLPCEPISVKTCECNEECDGGTFTSRCCSNRDFVCANTPIVTWSDLF